MKHEKMMDNRMVNENHQQGIERVKQRKGDMKAGQGGHMKQKTHGNFKVPDNAMTPRRA